MAAFPILRLLPPSDDVDFVRHVAQCGRRLSPRTALKFWRGRKTFLAKTLEGAGLEPDEIDEALEDFRRAVSEESARQRATVAAHQGPATFEKLPACPEKADARQRISSAECDGVSNG